MKKIFIAIATINITLFAQCYKDIIVEPKPFMGNNGEIFQLSNGTIWKILYEYEYLYEYYPEVIACDDDGYIIINGKKLTAQRLR